ncbi:MULTISPECIES: hypothetical protein [unclassified Frankia]|uniref:hypothetical protein n=1 Tax=unclassified Frankia TaxID=2632575 RepID=UPI001F10F897|nr:MULTISPECIES: hypothetical protein [unclassified Frankia]
MGVGVSVDGAVAGTGGAGAAEATAGSTTTSSSVNAAVPAISSPRSRRRDKPGGRCVWAGDELGVPDGRTRRQETAAVTA